VDSEAPLLYGYVRPDAIDELLLRDDLTRAVDKIDQNIQRSTVEGKHLAVASEHPLANRKFERTELQLPMNYSARHVSAKMRGFPRMPTVGRQTPQLCTRKVGHYEAHRPSHAFGKDELNLDITSTRRSSRTSRRCDDNDGNEQHAPVRPSCAARPVVELGRSTGRRRAGLFVRARCDADLNRITSPVPAEATCRRPSGH